MAAYTTARLLASIERKSFSPSNQVTFSTADILSLADEVTKSELLPAILEAREEFFVFLKDYSITADLASYAIPARGIGMMLREVTKVNSNGDITNLVKVDPATLHNLSTSSASPEAFYLQGNDIVLWPTPSTTQDTLRVRFFLRPGDLVETTAAAVVATIDTATNIITVTTIPSTWATGSIFDLSKKDGAHEYRSIDNTSTLISGTSITLPSLPTGLAVGDYVSLSGESALVQLPSEFVPVLADLVAAEMLMNMNQPSGKDLHVRALKRLETAQRLITPRVIGEPDTILPDWT